MSEAGAEGGVLVPASDEVASAAVAAEIVREARRAEEDEGSGETTEDGGGRDPPPLDWPVPPLGRAEEWEGADRTAAVAAAAGGGCGADCAAAGWCAGYAEAARTAMTNTGSCFWLADTN